MTHILPIMAALTGLLLLLILLPSLFAPQAFLKAIRRLLKASPLFAQGLGLFVFLLSLPILYVFYVQKSISGWQWVIFILGVLFFIKGILVLYWPRFMYKWALKMLKKMEFLVFPLCLLKVLIGLGLIYLGLYVY